MVNLRAIANSVTKAINPNVPATLYVSTGNIVDANFRQQPQYQQTPIIAQVQPVSSGDLRKLDSLNIQGVQKAAYLNGSALAINRVLQLGGDLLVFPGGYVPEGNTWLIKASLEQWASTWCKVALVLQDDSLVPAGAPSLDYSKPDNSQYKPGL